MLNMYKRKETPNTKVKQIQRKLRFSKCKTTLGYIKNPPLHPLPSTKTIVQWIGLSCFEKR